MRFFFGKCSTFGGPHDTGVGAQEGLALVQPADLDNEWFARLFLRFPERNAALGLARNLNPDAYYCAMRWNQVFDLDMENAAELARVSMVRVSLNTRHVWVQPADYGPGDGNVVDGAVTEHTGRLIDLSPGAAAAIGANTDDVVTVEVFE